MPVTYFSREKWIYIILALITVLIILRLFWLQVILSSDLKAKGVIRRTQDQSIIPMRGNIFDTQGHVLAQSVPVKEVYADPKTLSTLISGGQLKKTKEEIAQQLALILGIDKSELLNKLNKDLSWVSLAHQVDINKAEQIIALKIPGVGFNDEQKRVYPMEKIAASTLGIVKLDGHGVEGIEAFYDDILYGRQGYSSAQQDSKQRSIFNASQPFDAPQPGSDLSLTLDSTIQYLIEQQLDDLQATTKAKRLSILAMDPMTGKILGMGSRPTFNPNQYNESSAEDRRNLAVSMSYEPGSTFKVITGSAALEEGIVSPSDYFADPGFYKVGNRIITNWDSDQKPHGNVTFSEGMQLSSNVVLTQIGIKLGKPAFYTYLKAFGFGTKTGIDISGEENGLLVPQDRSREIDLATMSFGQANLVTPVQLLTAISAIANGGNLLKPYVVEKVTSPDGVVIKENKLTIVRQVISNTTASQMSKIMEEVVAKGTGKTAQIPGIRVAGKTGTAQKVDPKTGQYSKTDYIASFVAFEI
ncbi:MAG: penicillin-binding transpeptidase domain-containing protein, partial [Desulfitobacterium hafniense]|nr:penicillin-binding transpeptidase domain-containing protein [Desulfitobacterium hafniense]